jgi:ABC-2 type transport system permease protein
MNKYILTARMTARGKTIGGILFLMPDILVRGLCLIPLLMLWRSLYSPSDGDALANVLTYSFMAALLYELLSIRTPLTNWYYDGSAVSLYQRPMSVFGHVIAQALGPGASSLLRPGGTSLSPFWRVADAPIPLGDPEFLPFGLSRIRGRIPVLVSVYPDG